MSDPVLVGSVWTPKGRPDLKREVACIDDGKVVYSSRRWGRYCSLRSWLRWVREKEATCNPK